jgi:transcriptional regulator with XRE-family HTH domain
MTIPKRLRKKFSDKEFAHAYVDEFLNMSIATQLKVLREQQELTQKRLAELAGMKQERISVLENVNYSSWSINTLRKLAAAFDVRLRVSFETFGSCLAEMENFTRESLERMSREKELALDRKLESASLFQAYFELPINQNTTTQASAGVVSAGKPAAAIPSSTAIQQIPTTRPS